MPQRRHCNTSTFGVYLLLQLVTVSRCDLYDQLHIHLLPPPAAGGSATMYLSTASMVNLVRWSLLPLLDTCNHLSLQSSTKSGMGVHLWSCIQLLWLNLSRRLALACCSGSLCYSAPCKFSKGLSFSHSYFAVDVTALTPYSKLSVTKSLCNICSFQQGRRFLSMQNLDAHNTYRSKLLR